MKEALLKRTSFKYVTLTDKIVVFVIVNGETIMSLLFDKDQAHA